MDDTHARIVKTPFAKPGTIDAHQLLVPAPQTVRDAEAPVTVSVCAHEGKMFIGADRMAQFYRCEGCGSILVSQGGCLWILRPTRKL